MIVQTRAGEGKLVVTARAEGLKPATAEVRLTVAPAWPYQAVAGTMQPVPAFGISTKYDGYELKTGTAPAIARNDSDITARATVTPYAGFQSGGKLVFNRVAGEMSVLVDGKLAAQKTDPAEGPFEAPLPAGRGARVVALVFHLRTGQAFGLPGKVYLTA